MQSVVRRSLLFALWLAVSGCASVDPYPSPPIVNNLQQRTDPIKAACDVDGIVWRVTLNSAGEALVYDSMHACGCFHMFFPTDKVVARDLPETLDKTLFAPQSASSVGPGQRVALRIESGTHYLQRVSLTSEAPVANAVSYQLHDERGLTALPRRAGGSRSAYDQDGFIPGTERAERWFFWPMGIESAGQMRQWGRHATAFIGRRHFEDPLLFDAYFELRR